MHSGAKLAAALASLKPASFAGNLARRVGLAGLLTPIAAGGSIKDLEFLYAGRRRNRFTPAHGAKSLYLGEDEDVGSAETKRAALLGSFAKTSSDAAAIFWAKVDLPNVVLDLTAPAVLAALGTTDAEIHDPDWRNRLPRSASEILGSAAFQSGRFAAIKYWSVRMRAAGKSGLCYCIFKTRVKAPCSVHFTSPSLGLDERWP